jgi:SAM-dependent methyltransferase
MKTPWSDPVSMTYHINQWKDPKQSTIQFEKFISNKIQHRQKIIDLGCGTGASTHFIASRHSECNFIGIDLDPKLIETARRLSLNQEPVKNCNFEIGDCFDLSNFINSSFQGALSLQTLSWLDSWEDPMKEIYINLKPDWIGISSLFYPGDISAKITINEPVRNRFTNYNIISIKELNRHANKFGYHVENYKKFEIPIDIPKPSNEDKMGTYTLRVAENSDSSKIQISGPILMPWFFVLIEKNSLVEA